jgi:nitric oxide reductase NorD protein
MAEAEDVLLCAAECAASAVRRAASRRRAEDEGVPEPSAEMLRLDRWICACFGRSWPIVLCDRSEPAGWLRRSLARPAPWEIDPPLVAATDGAVLFLPREAIDCSWVHLAALALGLRLVRSERSRAATSRLQHDADWALEGARGDIALAVILPGLAASLERERANALIARPSLDRLRESERSVERLVQMLLRDPECAVDPDLAKGLGPPDPDYRGVAPVAHWGVFRTPDPAAAYHPDPDPRGNTRSATRSQRLARPVRRRAEPEDARRPGPFIVPSADPHLSVQDPRGLDRSDDRGEEDLDALAEEISRLEELAVVRSERAVREVLQNPVPSTEASAIGSAISASADALRYPEWDHRRASYRDPGILLREVPINAGDPDWANRFLQRQAPVIALLRRQFLALRPRLDRVPRQIEGDEVDVDGWIVEYADRVSGRSPRGQHYCLTRRRRRDVAVALLVDASGSTDSWISRNERVIDVAKEAALYLCEALSAVGDRHAIYAFSGQGAGDVRVWVAKRFEESLDASVRARIGALQPDRSTRLGGAIRHVTAALAGASAPTRILLVLSDGKPNDVDLYEGDYGVEDVRQAVCEARAAGVRSFCVTIDRRGPTYLAKLFGRSGYTLIWDATQLPQRFPQIYRHLTRGLSAG